MIISVAEFRTFYTTTESDAVIEAKLSALESMIRKYTNNNFQDRAARCTSSITGGVISAPSAYFNVGDTLQISEDEINNGLYILDENGVLDPIPYDSSSSVITRIKYPDDIKMGVVRLMIWSIERENNVGIASESISRHSVTYFNMDGDNSRLGFPKSLTGFLEPYKKARF